MDNLKKYVEENRGSFRRKSPLPGHWLRFRLKAYGPGSSGRRISLAQWASSSAAAVLLFAAMLPVLWQEKENICIIEGNGTVTPNEIRFARSQHEPLDPQVDLYEEPDPDTLNHKI